MAQPILSFKNFTGMADNGLYWCEGFAARRVNGISVLSTSYSQAYSFSEDTSAGYANLNVFCGMVMSLTGYAGSGTRSQNMLGITQAGRIFHFAGLLGNNTGEVHAINTALNAACNYADLFLTGNLNILYPGADYLGICYQGTATATTNDTQITDIQARNFVTLGLAVNDKVYNLKTFENHNITGIANGAATNDVLQFAAGSTVDASGDNFYAFADRGANNGGAWWNFFATTAYPHFTGQITKANFRRQIVQFDTDYLITNGNFIAALNVNETTWNDNLKQLPYGVQANTIAVNQTKILIGGEYYGDGRLYLWDGYSDGFLSELKFSLPVTAVAAYGSNFIFLTGKYLYETDGYSLKELYAFPDLGESGYLPYESIFSNLKVIGNKIFMNLDFGTNNVARNLAGLYIYEPTNGVTYLPADNDGLYFNREITCGALAIKFSGTQVNIYSSYGCYSGTYGATHQYFVNSIKVNELYAGRSSVMIFNKFDKPVSINRIGLNIQPLYCQNPLVSFQGEDNIQISVNIGKGDTYPNRYIQNYPGSTTTLLKNGYGVSIPGKIGSMIMCQNGINAGERSYITAIANPGTANEEWTISPALTATPQDYQYFKLFNLHKCETKNLETNNLPEDLFFEVSDMVAVGKVYIEIFVKPTTYAGIDILGINLY